MVDPTDGVMRPIGKTQADYPVSWSIQIVSRRLELRVDAIFDALEFDTLGTTNSFCISRITTIDNDISLV